MKISILMLTHNAMKYVYKAIRTVKKNTAEIEYELIILDNASHFPTKGMLRILKCMGRIDKLILCKENTLFAKGNNIASEYAAQDTNFILLLNSDIEIRNKEWLSKLVELCPSGGISSYGAVEAEPIRTDGYCMLIDKKAYLKHKLDEEFAWFWSVTKLQGLLLNEGKRVIAVKNHEEMLHHYGGKSGKGFSNAKGMGISIDEVKGWFRDNRVTVLDCVDA